MPSLMQSNCNISRQSQIYRPRNLEACKHNLNVVQAEKWVGSHQASPLPVGISLLPGCMLLVYNLERGQWTEVATKMSCLLTCI